MAAKRYPFADDVIFHSDRGVQSSPRFAGEAPTSQDFADRTNQLGIRRSVGRTGVCYDNAQAETFNSALKNERVNRAEYPTREHARKDVTRYIEVRYPQASLGTLGTGPRGRPTTTTPTDDRQRKDTSNPCPRNAGHLTLGLQGREPGGDEHGVVAPGGEQLVLPGRDRAGVEPLDPAHDQPTRHLLALGA
jgi:hypothetical protein